MANVSVGWEVEGIISIEESVSSMLKVIGTKTLRDTGKFFTWEGKVGRTRDPLDNRPCLRISGVPMVTSRLESSSGSILFTEA